MKKKPFTWLVFGVRAASRDAGSWAIAVALCVVFTIPTISQTSREYEIPFESSRVFGLKTIRVEANGKPAVLIVDTASNRTILSSDLAPLEWRTLENPAATSKGSGLSGTGVFATASLRVVFAV